MRTVRWNKHARLDYFKNIDFLLQNWSEKEAQNFINKVFRIEFILAKGQVEFQSTDRPDIRRCVITKQITLFYRIIDMNHVELLRFWNNYQDLRNRKK